MMQATKLPPGPKDNFLETLRILRRPLERWAELSRRYGDPLTISFGGDQMVLTGQPEGIKSLLSAEPGVYGAAAIGDPLKSPFIGRPLFTLTGAEHRDARRQFQPAYRATRMQAYGPQMSRIARTHVASWPIGRPFALQKSTQSIVLEIALAAILGVEEGPRRQQLCRAFNEQIRAFKTSIAYFTPLRRPFAGFGPWSRFVRRRNELTRLTLDLIAARRAELSSPGAAERDDLLSTLVRTGRADGSPMSDLDILSALGVVLVADPEPVGISLAWALYHTLRDPAVLERLRAEVLALGPDPAPESVAQLPYLEAVCKETLRISPIAMFSLRTLAKPFVLLGYKLPAGLSVGAATAIAHFRPETYVEPQRFRPERFLQKTFAPYEYLPFGGGDRRCLGAAYAIYEMKIVLAEMLRGPVLRLVEDRPLRMDPVGFNFCPEGGVPVIC